MNNSFLNYSTNEEISKLKLFSGNIYDLGNIQECNKMAIGLYLRIEFQILKKKYPVFHGICYFKDCGIEYLKNNKLYLEDYISKLYNESVLNSISIIKKID